MSYIWERLDWPYWKFDSQKLASSLALVHLERGKLLGSMQSLGLELSSHATLEILTEEVIKSSAIEGEKLDPSTVHSSVAKRLGIELLSIAPSNRYVDGIVEVVLDATRNYKAPLTEDRLWAWQAALFPTGRSGLMTIITGMWRTEGSGSMRIVSGVGDRERIHYEALPADRLDIEMKRFIDWFESSNELDPMIKAGIAHLWFETLHPFEDGNGRIGRAVCDMALTRADQSSDRFYSLSTQIEYERKSYYQLLENAQKGDLDITEWLNWFLACVTRAITRGHQLLASIKSKANFWKRCCGLSLNARQVKMLNMLIDGFEGNLTTSKWAQIAKCSQDTALRDIKELMENGILAQANSGGRSTHYKIQKLID